MTGDPNILLQATKDQAAGATDDNSLSQSLPCKPLLKPTFSLKAVVGIAAL